MPKSIDFKKYIESNVYEPVMTVLSMDMRQSDPQL